MAASRPHVNLSDIPELMPGAQPSANPAQREHFEQRCIKLHAEEVEEKQAVAAENQAAAGAGPASAGSGLESMFPNLDPALIRAICSDSPSQQGAIETLLALSAAAAEPHNGTIEKAAVPTLPPLNVGLEDHDKFPSLVDSKGWQVGCERQFDFAERMAGGKDEELGSAWRDHAQTAGEIPAPQKKAWGPAYGAGSQRQRRQKEGEKDCGDIDADHYQPMTDYEIRQHCGQRRAKHRVQYGRGGGRGYAGGRGRGAVKAGAYESQSELSEDSGEDA